MDQKEKRKDKALHSIVESRLGMGSWNGVTWNGVTWNGVKSTMEWGQVYG